MAVRSMTGFASVAGSIGEQVPFTLTIKTVNHRFLDLQLRLPPGCEELEAGLRRLVKEHLRRGHVDVALTLERTPGGALRLNEGLLAAYLQIFRDASATHSLAGEPELNGLLRLPGVIGAEQPVRPADLLGLRAAVMIAAEAALVALNAARAQEGAALETELRSSMRRIREFAAEVSSLRDGVLAAQFYRLRQRLAELTAGVAVAEDRVLAEAAVLADRSDIEEELVRLRTHAERFLSLLDAGGGLGKQTDFLLQELNREANTMLSKTGSATGDSGLRVTELGLAIKTEIERAREQVQNLE